MPDSRETGPPLGGTQETLSDAVPVRRSFHLERGSQVGRYVVLEPIGSGGMNVVYAAYDPELDRKLALKVMRYAEGEQGAGLERERLRLLREAQAMARLTHPNVVPIYDAGTVDDRVFIAMHFVDGVTLTQWLTEGRKWSEIVEYFVYAGRGLAAAHAAGLVHRDFKPDNVLIDRDGRVRVTDFGLARPSERRPSNEAVDGPSTGSASLSSQRLERPVTMAGAVLGTPAYMSPEQHLALDVDARSDQFSFCVALWEALTGERPFAGGTVGELAFAVTRGQIRSFPRESKVPLRIRRALERGLTRAPEGRFATMDALLAELAPRGRRRPLLIAGGALALVALGASLQGLGAEADSDPCAVARAGLDEIYGAAQRQALVDALTAPGGLASTAAEQLVGAFDGLAATWRASAIDTCVAHHIDGTQSDTTFDARMRCLGRRRAEFARLQARVGRSDPDELEDVMASVFDATSAKECDDVDRLLASAPPPDDPALRQKIDEIETRLDTLADEQTVGDERVARARSLLAEADAVGWDGARARALAALAHAYESRGDMDESVKYLRLAAAAAARAGDDYRMIIILGEIAFSEAHLRNRVEAALELAYLVELELLRVGHHPGATGVYISLGAVYQAGHDLERARGAYGSALAELDGRENPPLRAVVLNNLGTLALSTGDAVSAQRSFEAALRIAISLFGEGDPRLSDNYVNLCEAHLLRGDYVAARAPCERALALVDRPRPREPAALGRALHALGTLEMRLGNLDAAAALVARARPVMVSTFGEASYPHAATEALAASIDLYRGDLALAQQHAEAADTMLAALGPAFASSRTEPLWLRGVVAFAARDYENALARCSESLAAPSEAYGKSHPGLLEPLVCRGSALSRLGRPAEAIPDLERALDIYAAAGGDPLAAAHARFELARAMLAQGGALDRAQSLVRMARNDLVPVIQRAPRLAAELDAWLEEHP